MQTKKVGLYHASQIGMNTVVVVCDSLQSVDGVVFICLCVFQLCQVIVCLPVHLNTSVLRYVTMLRSTRLSEVRKQHVLQFNALPIFCVSVAF